MNCFEQKREKTMKRADLQRGKIKTKFISLVTRNEVKRTFPYKKYRSVI